MQVGRKRVSTFARTQAIIFLKLQRRIGIAESDSNTIAHPASVVMLPEAAASGRKSLSTRSIAQMGKRRKIGAWKSVL
jgi:hypothetical protein